MEHVVSDESQMNGYDAVVYLPSRATVLSLDACGFGPLLRDTGLVNDADVLLADVIPDYDLLDSIPSPILVPTMQPQELLEGPGGNVEFVGDWLDRLPIHTAQLTFNIRPKMPATLAGAETITELTQELPQLVAERSDIRDLHAESFLPHQENRSAFQAKYLSTFVAL
jgi:hypothetical protein